ncbi:AraC-like DNA-binding protein [Inquilinus ginsengisoli]|uniref:AraC-like DNA-binding protein n=1 Tax=Inquilinus ginsengisoli TaxID=363840 RepID=A0ABU1K100_9PROT|nr:helix-turn-helix transcriptional regulator [Inquilinus ginsengisoli]MDR6294545.1 AraC-like DNA-binding protein [Inquilinus ginsengisoli]
MPDRDLPFAPLRLQHEDGHRTPAHGHDRAQVFLVAAGALLLTTASGTWAMPAGHVAWIPPGLQHEAVSHGRLRALGAYLPASRCAGLPEAPALLRRTALLAAVLERLGDAAADAPVDRTEHLLAVLLDEIATTEQDALDLPLPRSPRLLKLVAALMADPAERRGLDDLARDFALSRRSLTRLFRQETGLSLGQWRLRRRVIAAIALLAEGQSVTDIALTLGHESVGAFSQSFRKIIGVPPTAYRPDAAPSA